MVGFLIITYDPLDASSLNSQAIFFVCCACQHVWSTLENYKHKG